jgi:hypothetical protein
MSADNIGVSPADCRYTLEQQDNLFDVNYWTDRIVTEYLTKNVNR